MMSLTYHCSKSRKGMLLNKITLLYRKNFLEEMKAILIYAPSIFFKVECAN